jgi:hypothetical protein
MTRKSNAFMFLSFALINFFLFPGIGMKALGVVFLILGIVQLVTKPKVS